MNWWMKGKLLQSITIINLLNEQLAPIQFTCKQEYYHFSTWILAEAGWSATISAVTTNTIIHRPTISHTVNIHTYTDSETFSVVLVIWFETLRI